MFKLESTDEIMDWLENLRDLSAYDRIAARLARIVLGNFGDVKQVGNGIGELRFDFGPGYRVYFQRRGAVVILLLCGGDKSSQAKDINRAAQIAAEIPNQPGWLIN
jgi:putative addiction module killer protein